MKLPKKCIFVGTTKHRRRISRRRFGSHKRLFKQRSSIIKNQTQKLIATLVQLLLIYFTVNLEINLYVLRKCHEDIEAALVHKNVQIYETFEKLENGWISLIIKYQGRNRLFVDRDCTLKELFHFIQQEYQLEECKNYYIRYRSKCFHIAQEQLMELKMEEISITNNSEIELIRSLPGGMIPRRRKRSDKEEMDASESEEEYVQPSKRRRITIQGHVNPFLFYTDQIFTDYCTKL